VVQYNYFRDYDRTIVRYVESDPVGVSLREANTFSYVESNPINWEDRKGLFIVGWGLVRAALEIICEATNQALNYQRNQSDRRARDNYSQNSDLNSEEKPRHPCLFPGSSFQM